MKPPTLDGVPLGDQQYGNYNGLSVSRAVSSENVSRVELASGAGALGVASTSETGGSYGTNRTFVRWYRLRGAYYGVRNSSCG